MGYNIDILVLRSKCNKERYVHSEWTYEHTLLSGSNGTDFVLFVHYFTFHVGNKRKITENNRGLNY